MKRFGKTGNIIAVLLVILLVVSGCSSSGGSSNSKQTLSIITWVNPPAVNVLKKINKEFEKKYPNIQVNFKTAPSKNYDTLQQTSVQGGTADIMSIHPFMPLPPNPDPKQLSPVANWAMKGVFLKLNDQPWVKDFRKSMLSAATYKGNVYGLVTGAYQFGVFYNKDTFAKYHLAVPQTYSELIKVAKTLKSHGVTPFFDGLQGVGSGYLTFIYTPLIQELWKPENESATKAMMSGKLKWTDPEFIQVMKEEKEIASYLEPNYTGVAWQSMPGSLGSGKAAMLLDGSWDIPGMQEANKKLNIGYFPLPGSQTASKNTPTVNSDLTFTVLNSSKHKEAALKWLSFFASPKIYAQYADATGISPSRIKGSYKGEAATVLGDWYGKGVPSGDASPYIPSNGPYWLKNWSDLQLDVVQGKYTPEQAASMYQKAWDTYEKQGK